MNCAAFTTNSLPIARRRNNNENQPETARRILYPEFSSDDTLQVYFSQTIRS